MKKIIFVKVRNDKNEIYSSYCDYWQLVNLSGFETCELDEVEPQSDNTYIFSPNNGNVIACVSRPHSAKYILWQLERPNHVENYCPKEFDETWVSDRSLTELGGKYVTMGGHPKLGREVLEFPDRTDYDYAPISYIYGKREHQVNQLIKEGARIAPMAFSKEEKDAILKNSRYGLALHQDELPVIEPLRYTLFACYGLPIVAEKSKDFYPYKVIQYPNITSGSYKEMAEYNYTMMTKVLTFEKCVKESV